MVWPITSSADTTTAIDAKLEEVEYLIYAHFPGVKGSVTDSGYEGWVRLNSIQWGLGLGISSTRWRGRDDDDDEEEEEELDESVYPERDTSDPSVSEISVSKDGGPESGKLLHYTFTKRPTDVTIALLTRRASILTRTSAYILHRTLISGFSRSASTDSKAAEAVRESISLNFGGVESISYAADGTPVDSVHYHLTTNTVTYKTWNAETKALEVAEVTKRQKKEKKAKKSVEKAGDEEADGKVDGEEAAAVVDENKGVEEGPKDGDEETGLAV